MLLISGSVVGIAILMIAVWDVIAQVRGGITATISYWFWTNASKYPEIPFLLGFVCGHLVWSSFYDLHVVPQLEQVQVEKK